MTTMTRELYDVAVAIASDWRGGYLPKPYRLTGQPPHVLPKRSKAVYIAVDGAGVIRYVGSVSRTRSTAVRERTSEHVRHWFKERNWSTMYVVPLDPETPSAVVKALEGRIGRRLKPTDNRRLPAPIFM
jgi:hypothetical protein